MPAYPTWHFFPQTAAPPGWTYGVVEAFGAARSAIDTESLEQGLKSNAVLAVVRPALQALQFEVEDPDTSTRLRLPAAFKRQGAPVFSYHLDAYHPGHRVAVEVEAGRAASNNADYKALVEASILPQVDYLALAVPLRYVPDRNKRVYEVVESHLVSVFAAGALSAGLSGALLVGY